MGNGLKKLQLSYAGHLSDRVQDLYYGAVEPEGIDLHFIPLPPFQAFNRMLRGEFHCGEMSFSTYIIKIAQKKLPFVAIPVFPSRTFRHNAIYVNRNAGITEPKHLAGCRVGVAEYSMTAAVWARGMLKHEYGVKAEDIKWFTGGLTQPGRRPLVDLTIPGVDIRYEETRSLNDMLVSGDVEALIAPQLPPSIREAHSKIAYLFPNYPEVEREYFRKTGIFPIMHTVVLRQDVYEAHPWAAVSLYQAFEQAKENCLRRLSIEEPLPVTLPWVTHFAASVRNVMGDDYWPYGIAKNRKTIEALCEYVAEQGIAQRKVAIDELFAPSVAKLSNDRL
jgi:4,5-dihydroxyphthalate decarboxylase